MMEYASGMKVVTGYNITVCFEQQGYRRVVGSCPDELWNIYNKPHAVHTDDNCDENCFDWITNNQLL